MLSYLVIIILRILKRFIRKSVAFFYSCLPLTVVRNTYILKIIYPMVIGDLTRCLIYFSHLIYFDPYIKLESTYDVPLRDAQHLSLANEKM